MDLLNEWLYAMKLHKWRNALQSPHFSKDNLEYIANNIDKFFPKNIYQGNKKNWLNNFLSKKDPMLIGFAIQLSKIIDYYYQLNRDIQYSINTTKKGIEQIRDEFSELYINYLFNKNNIPARLNDKYYVQSKLGTLIEKPLDSLIEFEKEKYIVECKKVYNATSFDLTDTMMKVVEGILVDNTGIARDSYGDTIPSGYVFFKDKSKFSSLVKLVEKDFRDSYNEYLEGMGLSKDTLTPKVIKRTEDYEICIEFSIFDNFAKFEKMAEEFPLAILFNSRVVSFHRGAVRLGMQAFHKYTETEVLTRVRKIIEKKIDQHKYAPYQKIIVIDFEEEQSIQSMTTLYIDIFELNAKRIESLVKDDVSILFVSTKHYNGRTLIKARLFSSRNLNTNLAAKLANLNLTLVLL